MCLSGNVTSETQKKGLCRELQRPDADLLDAAFARGPVVEYVASKSVVHLWVSISTLKTQSTGRVDN